MTLTPPNPSKEARSARDEGVVGAPGKSQDPHHDVPEPAEQSGDDEPEPSGPERVRTGSDRVDDVIRAVEELEERPIEEHVGVFESAQVQLRRALDDPGDGEELVEPDDHADHA
jgi:hypothetical protein